jgi:hypothetical protein
MIDHNIIIDGDELEMLKQIDTIHEMIEVRDSDHVQVDGMYLVDENGKT